MTHSARSPLDPTIPWPSYFVVFRPHRLLENLERVHAAGLVEVTPNVWQICLGVIRMWHRVLFRSDTVGTCAAFPIRPTWRARLLHYRPLRFPFLLRERVIAPFDYSGLLSPTEQIVRHLLGAHHDGAQFVYDLELLSCYPGKLDEVHDKARALIESDTPRSRWLRDLTVYERYHENLLAALERALKGDFGVPPEQADDPDISFRAYLRWCARQPATPEETLAAIRRGLFSIERGLSPEGALA
jgi:hypothetical protein